MVKANELLDELSDLKIDLKAAMFGNKLASFVPSGDSSLGKLVFTSIKVPFKTLGITDTELEPMDDSCEQLVDSTAKLTEMSIDSKLTIREHCDSLRNKVDIPREITTLMPETDGYERVCLSSLAKPEESTEQVVKQRADLQRVQLSDEELIPRLNEANKLLKELSDLKSYLKAAMFGNKLASFVLSGDSSLGKYIFTPTPPKFHSRQWASLTPSSSRLTSMATADSS